MKVYMLLDRSGSMSSNWAEVVSSINEYANGLKDTKIRLVAFDSAGYSGGLDYQVLRSGESRGWDKLNVETVTPRGGTPLYDSFIKITNEILADKEDKSVVVVISDGDENTSKVATHDKVKERIDLLENVVKTPVIFLGANFDTKKSNYVGTMDAHSLKSTRTMEPGNFVHDMFLASGATMNYFNTNSRSALYADAK